MTYLKSCAAIMKAAGLTAICLMLLCPDASAQTKTKTVRLQFIPSCGTEKIDLSDAFKSAEKKASISVFKCYVSRFFLLKDGRKIWSDENSFFLIDASKKESLERILVIPENAGFDEIQFCLGIDDKTNETGIGDGDLDPLQGMYWAWQSGYINMKLEGESSGKPFEYHLGGFEKPYAAFRKISLRTSDTDINIYIDPCRFLSAAGNGLPDHVMSPGFAASTLSDIAATMFHL